MINIVHSCLISVTYEDNINVYWSVNVSGQAYFSIKMHISIIQDKKSFNDSFKL